MNELVIFQPRSKLNLSFDVERSDFANYQKSNFGDWSAIFPKKHVGLDAKQMSALVASIYLYPSFFVKFATNVNQFAHINSKPSAVDYMCYYIMSNERMVEANDDAGLTAEFEALVRQWKDETFLISSSTKLFNHPAYIRIIAMGTAGLPLVLRELQKNTGRWFYALKYMAGEDGKGVGVGMKDYDDVREAWLKWGYENNYI